MNEKFDERVREEALFLVSSARDYLKKLNTFLEKLKIEDFMKTLEQLHRAFGEILGLTKYMQENMDKFSETYYSVMNEMQLILQETFNITESFIRELKKRINNVS